MAAALLPPPFWFRWSLRCPRVDLRPRPAGRLIELPDSGRLPIPSELDGTAPWWEVRMGWSPLGLAVGLDVRSGRRPAPVNPDHPELADGLQLWIDTRDTRDVHRATRYCHRFQAAVAPDRGSKGLKVILEQRKINRAIGDAPLARPGAVQGRAGLARGGWWLDLFLPAEALNGFDPETNPRLGMLYALTDPERGDRFLTVGRDFPIGEDPSLWATLELRDDPAPDRPAAARPRRRATPRA